MDQILPIFDHILPRVDNCGHFIYVYVHEISTYQLTSCLRSNWMPLVWKFVTQWGEVNFRLHSFFSTYCFFSICSILFFVSKYKNNFLILPNQIIRCKQDLYDISNGQKFGLEEKHFFFFFLIFKKVENLFFCENLFFLLR